MANRLLRNYHVRRAVRSLAALDYRDRLVGVLPLLVAQSVILAPLLFVLLTLTPLAPLLFALAFALLTRRACETGGAAVIGVSVATFALFWAAPFYILAAAFPTWMALGVAAAAGAALALRGRPAPIRVLWCLAALGALLLAALAAVYIPVFERERRAADETLRPVGRFLVDQRRTPELTQLRMLAWDPKQDTLVVSRGYDNVSPDPGVLLVRLADGRITVGAPSPVQALAVDAERRRLYAGHIGDSHTIGVYDLDTLAPLDRWRDLGKPVRLNLSADGQSLWVLGEGNRHVEKWDPWRKELLAQSPHVSVWMPYAFEYSEQRHSLYVGSAFLYHPNPLGEVDADTLEFKPTKRLFLLPIRGVVLDERRGLLFATRPVSRRLEVYDSVSLALRRTLPAPTGAYAAVMDLAGQHLFVGSFTTGELWKIDIAARRCLWKGFVGRRIRHLFIHPPTGLLYGTSSLGVFEIDPRRCR